MAATPPQNGLYERGSLWSRSGIQTKILIPLFLLMTLAVLGSVISFVLTTNATRNRLLDQQLDADTQRIVLALEQSKRDALESARRLSIVLSDALLNEHQSSANNLSRQMVDMVVPVRERFGLDQVLVLDAERNVRVNIGPSNLESIHIRHAHLFQACTNLHEDLAHYDARHVLIVCAPITIYANADAPGYQLGHVYTILDMRELLTRVRGDLQLAGRLSLAHHTNPDGQVDTLMGAGESTSPYTSCSTRMRQISVPLGDHTFTFTLIIDTEVIDQIVGSGLRVMLLSNGVAILLSLLMAAFAIRQLLIKPIIRLTNTTEQIARGNLAARAGVEAHDEIGQLAQTFNATAAELQELVTRLEQRVAQRTSELTTINEHLQQEISERRLAEDQIQLQKQELERLAITDELTGLYNRRHFFTLAANELHMRLAETDVLAAMMLDLDYFKRINDTYGHATGDLVLRVIAQRCRHNLRDTDIVGRYGGEEFAILLPRTDIQTAQTIAERLREDIAHTPIETSYGPVSVTISVGIAAAVGNTLDLARLLNHADMALYAAKNQGRNRVVLSQLALELCYRS